MEEERRSRGEEEKVKEQGPQMYCPTPAPAGPSHALPLFLESVHFPFRRKSPECPLFLRP